MPMVSKNTHQLIRESLLAVKDILRHAQLVKAWELLQERDREGNPRGPLPYTDQALTLFKVAHDLLPGHLGVVHHLAIGHHARAWDMELQGNPRAADEWEAAMGYWRVLAASGEFWIRLKEKLKVCDGHADGAALDVARQGLLEDLLDIHVDFVRHYCELGDLDRAAVHVGLVARARIPPAIKKRLIDRVFDAMTGAVAEAREAGAYESALTPVQRFLNLFPETPYLPALRLYAELVSARLAGTSYQEDWEEIVRLGAEAEPLAARLAGYPDLERQAMARIALEKLTEQMAMRGYDRGNGRFQDIEALQKNPAGREEAAEAFEFAVRWGRLGAPCCRDTATVRQLLVACLNSHAICLRLEAAEVGQSEQDPLILTTTCLELCRRAVAEIEEASEMDPDDKRLLKHLSIAREELAMCENQRMRLDLGDPGELP